MKRILLVVSSLFWSVVTDAAELNLYSGEVVVPGQQESDRKEAVPEALVQVLQKLSGRRELPVSPVLDQALSNAERLLLAFRYKNVERTASDGSVSRELHLVTDFMPTEVDRIVRQAGLPRWRRERPAVQLWVVLDEGLGRELKPVEYDYAWQSMETIAATRGLPVSWPDLDEEQMQLLDMGLVWGGFTDYLVERGAPADGVAIVAVRREGPQWNLRWNLAVGERHWSWRNADRELMFALAEGIHLMTGHVAANNSIAASDQGVWTLEVAIGKLDSAADYAACLEYLQGLSLVTAIEVLGASPGRVDFKLQLNAASSYLTDIFDQGSVLLRAATGSAYDYEYLHR